MVSKVSKCLTALVVGDASFLCFSCDFVSRS